MILKELVLKNIRSYKEATIHFIQGISLFEGDIGSGKSTILYAIEFALFGLGDLDGKALIRTGTTKGEVTLKFEVDNNEYLIHRSLKRRGNSVRQEPGYILENGTRYDLSVSELKKWMLNKLDFKEKSHPRAGSVIYRYAVFVPQEEMKYILGLKPDERMQTLRKAFRIEDYRISSQNTSNVLRKLSREADVLRGEISDLKELKEELNQMKKSENQLKEKTEKFKQSANKISRRKEELKSSLEELETIGSQIEKKTTLIPQWEKGLSDIKEQNKHILKDLKDIEKTINDLIEKKLSLEQLERPIEKTRKELKKENSELLKEYHKLTEKLGGIKGKIDDYTQILDKGICPTCDRPVEAKEFGSILKSKQKSQEQTEKQKKKLHKLILDGQTTLEELKTFLEKKKELKTLRADLEKYKESHQTKMVQKDKLEQKRKSVEGDLQEAKEFIQKNKAVLERIEQVKKEFDDVLEELGDVQENLAANKRELKLMTKEIKKEKQRIQAKEEKKKEISKLENREIWLEDFFNPTLSAIEQHIMLGLNAEFDRLFQGWFSTLIEDPDIRARVDEQFTPIIEQNNYELSVDFLSGGEKTSVALAYRLALNALVKQVCNAMKSNLLILDEPTDGFSKDQLFKMREILDELGSEQVILVSHEAELESIADSIYRIVKTPDGSKIEIPSIQ